jgi:hypothetical protein
MDSGSEPDADIEEHPLPGPVEAPPDVAAHPDVGLDVPDPPEQEHPLPRRHGARVGSWQYLDFCSPEGEILGQFVFDVQRKKLNAHCHQAAHALLSQTCHMDRTCEGSGLRTRSGQGRPLGFLAAWLLRGPKCSVKELHSNLKKTLGTRTFQEERLAARQYLKQFPEFQILFELERPPRDGEGEEPELVP